ncbi:MAG: IPTL-CTERM sorting domain-containing protein [Thiolinea sp.]
MKITTFPLNVSVASLLAVLAPVQYASASDLVTNCVQVTGSSGIDSDSTPNNKTGFQAIYDAVNANPPVNEDDEACVKVLIPYDYGDAPDSPEAGAAEPDYPTLLSSGGARHQLGTDVYLGQCVDSDVGDTAQDAISDDNLNSTPSWGTCSESGDEDGVIFDTLRVGEQDIKVTVTASQSCYLNAWVDWDADGSWEGANEKVFADKLLAGGTNTLTLSVPTSAKAGDTYTRFRCSTEGGDEITGDAADGEVEDYKVRIEPAIVKVPVSLGNFIWLDGNKDGLQSSGEYGLVGATVKLLNADGTPARDLAGVLTKTQTITATGQYSFTNLPEGDYIVRVTPPAGYIPTFFAGDVDTNDSNVDSNCEVTADGIQTPPITLTAGGEPIAGIDGDDNNSNMTADCGFYKATTPKYSVGNQIWVDDGAGTAANANNGLRDAGETNVSGAVQVELRNTAGDILTTLTTNNGFYVFSNLEAGDYKVCLSASNFASGGALEGYAASTGGDEIDPNLNVDGNDNGSNDTATNVCSGVVSLNAAEAEPVNETPTASGTAGDDGFGTADTRSNLTVDFGLVPPPDPVVPVSVGSYIWDDVNENGVQDAGESGLAGAQVTLLNSDGSPVTDLDGQQVVAQTTDTSGEYLFSNLPEGDYIISVVPPAEYLVTIGGADVDANTSNTDNNCSVINDAIQTQPFTLVPGTEPDTAADGNDRNGNMTVDCGFYQPKPTGLSLGDYVWVDADVDGFQDNDENGLKGVTVSLTDGAGNTVNDIYGKPVASTTTDAGGLYRFDDLPAGDYVVNMAAPSGYYLTLGGLDVDDDENNQDSNCIISESGVVRTHPVTLSVDGEPIETVDGDGINGNMTADCGYYRTVSVGNYIWEDVNANGLQDAGESGLPDMTVSLTGADGISPVYDVNGDLVEPIVTDSSGFYEFTDLEPGEYSVTVKPPEEGYKPSPGGADPDNNASDSDNNCNAVDGVFQTPAFKLLSLTGKENNPTVDCGFYRPVGVGSRIWIDLNGDGKQDAGEPGVPRATVTLLNPDGSFATDLSGNVVQPQVTGSNGEYFFGNLREGDYVLKVTPPDGYLPTIDNGDPDNNDGTDSNGTQFSDGSVLSSPITLTWGDEPDDDGDGDRSTNLTVGFGFVPTAGLQIPTASSWALGLLSLLLSAAAFWRRRRDS